MNKKMLFAQNMTAEEIRDKLLNCKTVHRRN